MRVVDFTKTSAEQMNLFLDFFIRPFSRARMKEGDVMIGTQVAT